MVHAIYAYYSYACMLQLPLGALMLWLRYVVRLRVLHVEILSPPVVLGGVAYYAPTVCPSDNNTTAAFTTLEGAVDLTGAYFIACVAACGLAVLYNHAIKCLDSMNLIAECHADAEDADGLSVAAELVFWLFVVAHALAEEGLGTGELATLERMGLRVAVRVGGLMVACGLPRTPRNNMMCLCAVLCLFGEAWLSLDAVCSEEEAHGRQRIVVCLLQRSLDVLLLVGHKADPTLESRVRWCSRIAYVAGSCVLLQAGVLLF